ncbi:MAG: hypothetical protein WBY53_18915 [Acidobacteriaceae bacterium]
MNSNHLTSEEMDALLIESESRDDSESRERWEHLRACTACAEEFESLRAAVSDLRGAVVGSAELHRRAAVMPAPAHRTRAAMWSLVAATALLCVAGPVVLHHKTAHVAVVVVPKAAVQAPISDEQLMSDIQQDLSASVPQAMLPLTAKDASGSGTDAAANAKENE